MRYVEEDEGSPGHGLETTGKNELWLLKSNGLSSVADGFQTWGADLIDGCAGDIKTGTSADWYLSGWSLTESGSKDVAEDDLVDFFGVEVDWFEDSFDCKLSEFWGVEGGEFTVEAADGCSFGSHDVYASAYAFGVGEEIFHVDWIIYKDKSLFYLRPICHDS